MKYLSEADIVEDILSEIQDEDDLNSWKNVKREDIILGHHSIGQAIRNHYGLWKADNPYVNHTDAMHDNFPDQMSHRIMLAVWDRLHVNNDV